MTRPSSDYAIETEDLTRIFRSTQDGTKKAIDGLTLCVERGELMGLLGPNGAGKTSTVKVLMTVLLPTSGHARILGHDVVSDAQQVRRITGVILGGDAGLYARLSARDNLLMFADLYGVPYREQRQRVPRLLEMVGLLGSERNRVETYSRGMKQRLHIARGLLHDPSIVILDEPTNGIDPVGARELRALIRDQVCVGRTVLMTTHYMFEADELCDRVAVLRNGQKIAEGTPASLKKQTDGRVVLTLELIGLGESHMSALKRLPNVHSVSMTEHDGSQTLDLHCGQDQDITAAALAELRDVKVLRVAKREPTLEDAYVSLVSGDRP